VSLHRLTRVAAVAAVCVAAGTGTVAIADARPATRYSDIEANKASSMRALGLHMAKQREDHTSRYQDLEANKARSQCAR
jgi:hypothetical protein